MNGEEPTLLSHVTEVRSAYLPEGGISTVIFCGKLRAENDLHTATEVHRHIVESETKKQKKKDRKTDKSAAYITGILIGQGNSIIHLLEGPSDAITRIISSLSDHEHFKNDASVAFQSGRIVYITEDRPERFFPEWFSCKLEERRTNNENVTAETCNDIVHDLASGLTRLGSIIGTESQEEVEYSKYSDHIPGKATVLGLAGCAEFFSLRVSYSLVEVATIAD
jgi:hypothetical protein